MRSCEILTEYLACLRGLPCWGVRLGYGSFLWFNFGQPYLDILEPNPASKYQHRRRRRVSVEGEHRIWVEQCRWYILINGDEIAWSESSEARINKAIRYMDSEKLYDVEVEFKSGKARFAFESRAEIWLERYQDFRADDPLWHLYSGDHAISHLADGHLQYGRLDEPSPETIAADNFFIDLT